MGIRNEETVEQVNSIRTREELAEFVTDLCHDLRDHQAEWTNKDLPTFLEAVAAWVGDMDGFYLNQGLPVPETPDWSTIAYIL